LRSFAASSGRGPAALPNHPLSSFGQQKARATSPGLFVINTGKIRRPACRASRPRP
jgi:hypothetical protein